MFIYVLMCTHVHAHTHYRNYQLGTPLWSRVDLGEIDTTGETAYFKHIGLYAYRPRALVAFVDAGPSLLEQRESLEQLRALELGMRIKVVEVDGAATGVDTKEQLETARDVFRSRPRGVGEAVY